MHDDLLTPYLLAEAERIAANQHKDGRYAAARVLRILCHRLSQRPVVDEAMVDRACIAHYGGCWPGNQAAMRKTLAAALAPFTAAQQGATNGQE